MRATVECAVCGRKLEVDTGRPVNPEELGWREIPVCEASFAAMMEGRTEEAPVCPECMAFHSRLIGKNDQLRGRSVRA